MLTFMLFFLFIFLPAICGNDVIIYLLTAATVPMVIGSIKQITLFTHKWTMTITKIHFSFHFILVLDQLKDSGYF